MYFIKNFAFFLVTSIIISATFRVTLILSITKNEFTKFGKKNGEKIT